MPDPIRIRLLGPPEVTDRKGVSLGLTGRKILALIGFLAAESDRSHHREELAALLWGDMGEDRARHNLRQAVSKIRQSAPALIAADEDRLSLTPEASETDINEFRRLISRDDPDSLERGLDLYRGDFLSGLSVREPAFDEWLRDRRMEIRDRACGAFDRLVAALAREGRKEKAVEALHRQLTLDPCREESHVHLMQLLAEQGRRSEALRQYERCAQVLSRELGVEPGAATRKVYGRILDQDAGGQAAPRGPSGADRSVAEPPSIAVLPFESLSGEAHRYFADGLAEDIIVLLSRFSTLVVIARESSFSHREPGASPERIGSELGARFLVMGKLRVDDQRLRLNVQLVDAEHCKYVWTEMFDKEIEDVFALQREVAETLVSIVVGRVEAARQADVRRIPEPRLDAYECVLRGKEYHHRGTVEDCQRAIEMFEQAIERDPEYPLAHAWLGCALGQALSFQPERRAELLGKAEDAANRARLLDENEAESYRILAQVALQRGDLRRARTFQERALVLNPNDDRSVCAMGTMLTLGGNASDGEGWIRRAMRMNPYHPESVWFHLARALFHLDRHDEALLALDSVTRPGVRELVYRIAALAAPGDDGGAAATAMDDLRRLSPQFDIVRYVSQTPFEKDSDRAALREAFLAAQKQ